MYNIAIEMCLRIRLPYYMCLTSALKHLDKIIIYVLVVNVNRSIDD